MKMKLFIASLAVSLAATMASAETLPEKPHVYFNDYASVIPATKAMEFNEQLAQFERDTSNQFLVVIYPKMDTDSDIADYTQRIAHSWQVGQKDKNNGLVLFIFPNEHKMFAQVGYGLEGAIPDATAFNITERVIKPYFKQNNFPDGIQAGINAFIGAAKGEYQGTGRTVAENPIDFGPFLHGLLIVFYWILGIGTISAPFIAVYIHRRNKRLAAEAAERAKLQDIQDEKYRQQRAERQRQAAIAEEKRRREWAEYLKNETPSQRKARLAQEAAAVAAAALARKKADEEAEEARKRRSRDDDNSSSSGYSSGYSGGSSYSSDSSSSFSSGGGDFGGGGGGSSW